MDHRHVEPRGGHESREKVEQLIVRMADENRSWGYDRIVGALANLGHEILGSNGRQCSAPSRPAVRTGAQAHDDLGGIHSGSPGGSGGDLLFYSGGPYTARPGYILLAVLYPFREPEGGNSLGTYFSARARSAENW